ncbi:hypothetical protein K6119_06315 [Paracrocinitomix mangrovi]|uniref:hypothetical protein n=1 Tax=Paracrocinitomix mangrovi TaxID=2862509 RepID=UPI001C8DDEFC|nr:hypothetical protein [Paracrocinitomix mangrovi]UKN03126.1 hypothetical protein K6119_06315 [Paracrocinitomix mangrovi]
MPQVSVESIAKALKKVDQLDEDGLDRLIETYTLKQEALVNYILAAGYEYENEDLNVFSIYYFALVYEAFYQQGITLKTITDEMIEEFQDPFVMALDELNKNEDFEPLQDLINQHNLLNFMTEEIESEDSDGIVLDEDTQTQLFIVTTSMIGLMNAAT